MLILSCQNVEVPSRSAHSLYTVRTSVELSALGKVFFYANRGTEELSFAGSYGIDLEDYPDFRLRLPKSRRKSIASIEKRILILKDIVGHGKKGKDHRIVAYVTQAKPLRYLTFLKTIGFNIKIVLECHSEVEKWDKRSLARVDGLLFTTAALRDRIVEKFHIPEDIPKQVVYHRVRGAVPEEVVKEATPATEGFCLGYIGGLVAWKGVDILIECLQYLPRKVTVCIIGGKKGKDYQRIVSRAEVLKVDERVRFFEYVPHNRLSELTAGIDAFVLPLADSREGSLPMKVLDYMMLNKPILAARHQGVSEILEDGVTALFFDPGSSKELAERAGTLMDDRGLGGVLAQNAAKELENYTVEKWLNDIRVFLEAI